MVWRSRKENTQIAESPFTKPPDLDPPGCLPPSACDRLGRAAPPARFHLPAQALDLGLHVPDLGERWRNQAQVRSFLKPKPKSDLNLHVPDLGETAGETKPMWPRAQKTLFVVYVTQGGVGGGGVTDVILLG